MFVFSNIFKYWLIYTSSLVYLFCVEYVKMPWETPHHIIILLRIVVVVGSLFMAGVIISRFGDDMMDRSQSMKLFGESTLWRVWQWIVFPMLIWGIYKWDNLGIIIASVLLYFGMKCLITNHNKHIAAYKQELVVRAARQETAEKITL